MEQTGADELRESPPHIKSCQKTNATKVQFNLDEHNRFVDIDHNVSQNSGIAGIQKSRIHEVTQNINSSNPQKRVKMKYEKRLDESYLVASLLDSQQRSKADLMLLDRNSMRSTAMATQFEVLSQERQQIRQNPKKRAYNHISEVLPDYNYDVTDYLGDTLPFDQPDFIHQNQLVKAIFDYKKQIYVPIAGQPQFDKASRFYLPQTFYFIQDDKKWVQAKLIFHDFDIDDVEKADLSFSFQQEWYVSEKFEQANVVMLDDCKEEIQQHMEMIARIAVVLAHPKCSHFSSSKSTGLLPPFLKIENARCTLDSNLTWHIKDVVPVEQLENEYKNQGQRYQLQRDDYQQYVFLQGNYKLKSNQIYCGKYEIQSTKYNNFIWCLNAGLGIEHEKDLLSGGILHMSGLIFRILFKYPNRFRTHEKAKNAVALCIQHNNFDLRGLESLPMSFYGTTSLQKFVSGTEQYVLDELQGGIHYKQVYELLIDNQSQFIVLEYEKVGKLIEKLGYLNRPIIMQIKHQTAFIAGVNQPDHYIQTVIVHFVLKEDALWATQDAGQKGLQKQVESTPGDIVCFVQHPLCMSHPNQQQMKAAKRAFKYNDEDFADQQDDYLISMSYITTRVKVNPTRDIFVKYYDEIMKGSKFNETKNKALYAKATFHSLNFFIPVKHPYDTVQKLRDGYVQYAIAVSTMHESVRHMNWNLFPNAVDQFLEIVQKISQPTGPLVLKNPVYSTNIGKEKITIAQVIDINNRCVPKNMDISFRNQASIMEVRESDIQALPTIVQTQIKFLKNILNRVQNEEIKDLDGNSAVLPIVRFQVELAQKMPGETDVQQFMRQKFITYVTNLPKEEQLDTLNKLYKMMLFDNKTTLFAMLNYTKFTDQQIECPNYIFPAHPQLFMSVSMFNHTHGTTGLMNVKKLISHNKYMEYVQRLLTSLYYCLTNNGYCNGMDFESLTEIVRYTPQVLYNYSTLCGLKLYCDQVANFSVEKYLEMIKNNLLDSFNLQTFYDDLMDYNLKTRQNLQTDNSTTIDTTYAAFMMSDQLCLRAWILDDIDLHESYYCNSDLSNARPRSNMSMMSNSNSNDQLQQVNYETEINQLAKKVDEIPLSVKSQELKQTLHAKIERLQSEQLSLSADKRDQSFQRLQAEINGTQLRTFKEPKPKKQKDLKRLKLTGDLERQNRV